MVDMERAYCSAENDDFVLFGCEDGFDDRSTEMACSSCDGDSDHFDEIGTWSLSGVKYTVLNREVLRLQ